MNNLGVALLNQKRKREAIEAFNRATKINPAAPVARENINVAVTKYLPRITVPFIALWLFFNGLRALGERGDLSLLSTVIVLVGSAVAAVLLFRWHRFRRLPVEVRGYVKHTKQAKRLQTQRCWLLTSAQISGALLGLSMLMSISFLIEGNFVWNLGQVAVLVVLAAIFLGSIIGQRRIRKKLDVYE